MIRRLVFPVACSLVMLVKPASATEIEVIKDIPYLGERRAEKMDAYLPPKEGFARPLPVVIWIHGGGWIGGR
jgi:acetyl esterase/lipase